ncbi:unnamed protein product [Ixodes pacificus]
MLNVSGVPGRCLVLCKVLSTLKSLALVTRVALTIRSILRNLPIHRLIISAVTNFCRIIHLYTKDSFLLKLLTGRIFATILEGQSSPNLICHVSCAAFVDEAAK